MLFIEKMKFLKKEILVLGVIFSGGCYLINLYSIGIPAPQYFKFADIILHSSTWLFQLDWTNCYCGDGLSDITTYRSIGYPLLIAFFEKLSSFYHLELILYFQLGLWLYSAFLFGLLLKKLEIKRVYYWVGFFSYIFGWGWILQFIFKADGLYSSIFTILFVFSAHLILNNEIHKTRHLIKGGVLLLLLFLLREVTLNIAPIFFSLFIGDILRSRSFMTIRKSIFSFLIFCAPLIIFAVMQGGWNYYRSGGEAFFINLSARTALLAPLEHAIIANPLILSESTLFDKEFKEEIFEEINNLEVKSLNIGDFVLTFSCRDLQEKYGWSQITLTNKIKEEYFRLWRLHPLTMLKIIRSDILASRDLIFLIRPLETFEDYFVAYQQVFGDGSTLPHLRQLIGTPIRQWKWGDVTFIIGVNTFRIASIFVYLCFLISFFSALFNFIKKNNSNANLDNFKVFLMLLYIGYIVAYAAVHIEARYLAAVFPLPLLLGLKEMQRFMSFKILFPERRN